MVARAPNDLVEAAGRPGLGDGGEQQVEVPPSGTAGQHRGCAGHHRACLGSAHQEVEAFRLGVGRPSRRLTRQVDDHHFEATHNTEAARGSGSTAAGQRTGRTGDVDLPDIAEIVPRRPVYQARCGGRSWAASAVVPTESRTGKVGASVAVRPRPASVRVMRNRVGLLVLLAAPVAAVLAGTAAAAAGGSLIVSLLVAAAVLLIGGLQTLIVVHLRRLRRRLDQVAREVGTPRKATFASPAPTPKQREAQAAQDAKATVWIGGLPIPPMHLRFMNESEERFLTTARSLAASLARGGLQAESDVLDVGSGYGRLAVGLLERSDFAGTFLGFDILPRHVGWCTNVITRADDRFQFRHLDLLNQRYNPSGTMDPSEAVFPAADASIDVCALFSVFTHLYRPTVQRYLLEIARVLRPGGSAVTTWLLFDDDRLITATSDASAYPLRLQAGDGSRFMLTEDPLRAIGFPQDDVVAMAGEAGLSVTQVERGNWDTGVGQAATSQFQDLVILRR